MEYHGLRQADGFPIGDEHVNCTQCGAELQQGRVFCTQCGADNRASAGAAPAPAAHRESVWFVHLNGNSVGPLALDKVIAMINAGRVKPSTQVYNSEAAAWRRAVEVREFSQAMSARRIGAMAGAEPGPAADAFAPQGMAHESPAAAAAPLTHAVSEVRRERLAADIKSRDVKILVLGTALTLLALLLGASAGSRISRASRIPPELEQTWTDIREQETTYDDVVAILGEPAESSFTAMDDMRFDSCTWNIASENGTQYSIMVSFLNDKVTSKAVIPTSELKN